MAVDDENESPTTGIFVLRLRLSCLRATSGALSPLGVTAAQPF
jgi:hypothetical protein